MYKMSAQVQEEVRERVTQPVAEQSVTPPLKHVKDPRKVEAGRKGAEACKRKQEALLAQLRDAKTQLLSEKQNDSQTEGETQATTAVKPQPPQIPRIQLHKELGSGCHMLLVLPYLE